MKMFDLTVVSNGEDWEALYDYNKLIKQGHNITIKDVLEYLGVTFKKRYVTKKYNEEILCREGALPEDLNEVELE